MLKAKWRRLWMTNGWTARKGVGTRMLRNKVLSISDNRFKSTGTHVDSKAMERHISAGPLKHIPRSTKWGIPSNSQLECLCNQARILTTVLGPTWMIFKAGAKMKTEGGQDNKCHVRSMINQCNRCQCLFYLWAHLLFSLRSTDLRGPISLNLGNFQRKAGRFKIQFLLRINS
jgi:hypothetical protein